jgi:hypothetical protein
MPETLGNVWRNRYALTFVCILIREIVSVVSRYGETIKLSQEVFDAVRDDRNVL